MTVRQRSVQSEVNVEVLDFIRKCPGKSRHDIAFALRLTPHQVDQAVRELENVENKDGKVKLIERKEEWS